MHEHLGTATPHEQEGFNAFTVPAQDILSVLEKAIGKRICAHSNALLLPFPPLSSSLSLVTHGLDPWVL